MLARYGYHDQVALVTHCDRVRISPATRAFSVLVFSVSAVFEVDSALGGGEFVDEFSDAVPA